MAPTDRDTVEWQTAEIVSCLFDDGIEFDPCLEVDGSDDFDPVEIANKLRTIADGLNVDPAFQAALSELKTAMAKETAEVAFSRGVEVLCQSHVSQQAEVAPEMQIIRASVAFGLYVKDSAPELKSMVQSAMATFLNRRVGSWVNQKGGWKRI